MASVTFPTFPSVDMSKFEMPKFEMPKFEMPKFEMPKIEMPKIEADTVTNVAKDATYVTIGLAVLGFQKAQVRRREFTKAINDQFGASRAQMNEAVDSIETRFSALDSRLTAFEGKLDSAVEDLEKRLPERAGALLGNAHGAAKNARKQVRGLITSAT